MKALLVIDMPDDIDLNKWYAVTVVVDRMIVTDEELMQGIPLNETKTFMFMPLRPLPKTKERIDGEEFREWECEDHYKNGYANGWNDCLEEIKK